jgi:hypothetical protein
MRDTPREIRGWAEQMGLAMTTVLLRSLLE